MSFIGKILSFSFMHSSQPDSPVSSFGSTTAFKAALDSQATELQTAINALYDQLNSITASSSGAENIGSAPIAGIIGTTVYAQLAALQTAITAIVGGAIPPSSVTYSMEDFAGRLARNGGTIYAYKNIGGSL